MFITLITSLPAPCLRMLIADILTRHLVTDEFYKTSSCLLLTGIRLQSFSFSVAMQTYRVDVGLSQVIIGNEVLLKCDIPSFASDFVSVAAWIDSEGVSYARNNQLGIILAGVTF